MQLGTELKHSLSMGSTNVGRHGSLRAFACQNFFICFYTILDPETGSLNYTDAGHDLLYLCRSGEVQ